MKTEALLVLSLSILSGSSWAQGCPAGIPSAGNPACIPTDRENSPYSRGDYGSAQPIAPRMIWADRWGAFATDAATASLGAVIGMPTKQKAKKNALKECRSKGGKNCEVDFVYFNQCAVMIVGNKKYNIQGAATIELATQLGMKTCREINTNCRVYYSDCSMAERIQ